MNAQVTETQVSRQVPSMRYRVLTLAIAAALCATPLWVSSQTGNQAMASEPAAVFNSVAPFDAAADLTTAPAPAPAAAVTMSAASSTPAPAATSAAGATSSLTAAAVPDAGSVDPDATALEAEILALRASAHIQLDQNEQAQAAALQALELDPYNMVAVQAMVDVSERADSWRTSVAWWNRLASVTTDPQQQQLAQKRVRELRQYNASTYSVSAFSEQNQISQGRSGLKLETRTRFSTGTAIVGELQLINAVVGEVEPVRNLSLIEEDQSYLLTSFGLHRQARDYSWQLLGVASENVIGARYGLYRFEEGFDFGVDFGINTPYSGYTQSIAESAAEDFASTFASLRFRRFSVYASAKFANYSVSDRDPIGQAVEGTLSLTTAAGRFLGGTRLTASAYGRKISDDYDENRASVFTRFDLSGTGVYSLGLINQFGPRRDQQLELEYGLQADQQGRSGFYARLAGQYTFSPNHAIELSVNGRSLGGSDESDERFIGAYLTYRNRFGN